MKRFTFILLVVLVVPASVRLSSMGPVKADGGGGGEPAPLPPCQDVNGDGQSDVSDVVYFLQWRFLGGPAPSCKGSARPQKSTMVFFVRHVEVDPNTGEQTVAGRRRVEQLVRHFQNTTITHVFSSHKFWSLETVQSLAESRGIEVVQMPSPDWDGPKEDQIEPTVEALQDIPRGSVAVVAGHGATMYGMMAGLGVEVHSEDAACLEQDTSCLPCDNRSCFDTLDFDGLWVVSLDSTGSTEPAMVRLEYGI